LALKEENITPGEACFICDSVDELYASHECGFGLSILFDPFLIHEYNTKHPYIKVQSLSDLKKKL